MMTVDQAASSLFVTVKDTVTEKITRLAIPSDVQIGLLDNPTSFELFGRFSVSTFDFTSSDENDGVLNASSNHTIIAVSDVVTPLSGRIAIYLPSNPRNGQLHFIKDASGTSETTPIDIFTSDGTLIDNSTSQVINTEFGSTALFWFNDSWKTLVTGVGQAVVTGSGGTPTPPTLLTSSFLLATTPDPGMTGARTFVSSSNLSITDNGAGSTFFLDLKNTGVTTGTYTNATVTVDQKGRITAINSGSITVNRLTRYIYVDPSHPTTTPDGSIVNPFKNIDDANDVILSASVTASWAVILQTGYDYTAKYRTPFESNLPTSSVSYIAWNPQRTTSVTNDTSISSIGGWLYFDSGHNTSFYNIAVGTSRVRGNGTISFFNCYVGTLTRYQSTAANSSVNGHTIRAYNTVMTTMGVASSDQDRYSNYELFNCSAQSVTCNGLYCVGTTFGESGFGGISIYAYMMLQSCRFATGGGSISVVGAGASTSLKLFVDQTTRAQIDQAGITYSEEGFNSTFATQDVTRYDFGPRDVSKTETVQWPVTASAEVEPIDFMTAMAFSSSIRQGVGIEFNVPAGKTYATFEFWYMTPSSSIGGGFQIAMANRFLKHSSSFITSWSTFTDIDILPLETNERWRRRRVRIPFSTLKFSDRSYQFLQLIRNTDSVNDTNTSKLFIKNIAIELT